MFGRMAGYEYRPGFLPTATNDEEDEDDPNTEEEDQDQQHPALVTLRRCENGVHAGQVQRMNIPIVIQ